MIGAIVLRQRDFNDVADPNLIVQMPRAAAARILAQHSNAVAPSFGGVVPQRIAPQEPACLQLDMGTRRKPRQVAAARIDQLIAADGFGEIGDRSDTQLHGLGLLQISVVLGKIVPTVTTSAKGGP
jgi:hypothetical protein